MAFGNEFGERCLLEIRRLDVAVESRAYERVDQRFRNDDESHPQAREERFVERATIHHAAAVVRRLKRGERTRRILKVAVVVVFDDELVRRLRPLEQQAPARCAERNAKRHLM